MSVLISAIDEANATYAGKYAEYAYHGGPFDRGGADYYYWRAPIPHKWPDGTMHGERVEAKDMTPEEIEAYHAGYAKAEENGDRKDWGIDPDGY